MDQQLHRTQLPLDRSAVECTNAINDVFDLLVAEMRTDREAEDFVLELLGDRNGPGRDGQVREDGLPMRRSRVMDGRFDPGGLELSLELLPPLRANHEQVPHRL
jgi:hypothetical protein